MSQPTARQPRPRAATVLGWLLIAQGLLGLALFGMVVGLIVALEGAPDLLPAPLTEAIPVLAGDDTVAISAAAGVGVVSLISGVGLLRLQGWAWLLALITQGIVLVLALVDVWGGHPDYLSLALGVAQVYLLNREDVQHAVRAAGPRAVEAPPPPQPQPEAPQ